MSKALTRRRRSAVESFGCPLRYKLVVLEGVDDSGDETLRGRFFHVAAHLYIRLLEDRNLDADLETAREAFRRAFHFCAIPDHLIAQVEVLFFYWAENFELNLDALLTAEELQRSERREFRPDLVYFHPGAILEIVDWKTYFQALTEEQAREELQLRWYLIEAKKIWPNARVYRFTFVFVRINVTVSLDFTPDEIDEWEPAIAGRIEAIEHAESVGEFPPMPGSHCRLCRLNCPVADDPRRLPVRVPSREVAVKVAGEILVHEQRLKALRRALGGFCAIDGPVEVGGQIFGHMATETVRYPAAEALGVLARFKVAHNATIGRSGLGVKWRKVAPVVVEALNRIAVRRRGNRFGHKKRGELTPPGVIDVIAENRPRDDDEGI